MDPPAISEESAKIERQNSDIVRAFPSVNDFDQVRKEVEGTDVGDTNKLLDDKNQLVIKGSNLCVSPKKQQASGLDKKQVDLFDAPGGVAFEDKHVLLDSIIDTSEKMGDNFPVLDETFIDIGRTRRAVEDIVIVGAESEATPRPQSTEQMSRTVRARNSINLFISQALLFVKEFGILAVTNPLTYLVLLEMVVVLVSSVFHARESRERKRQGYSWNCTKIPYYTEAYNCSWTKKP